jgi:hypothetical protein
MKKVRGKKFKLVPGKSYSSRKDDKDRNRKKDRNIEEDEDKENVPAEREGEEEDKEEEEYDHKLAEEILLSRESADFSVPTNWNLTKTCCFRDV